MLLGSKVSNNKSDRILQDKELIDEDYCTIKGCKCCKDHNEIECEYFMGRFGVCICDDDFKEVVDKRWKMELEERKNNHDVRNFDYKKELDKE